MHVLSVLRNISVNTVYDIFSIIINYSYLFHLDDLSPLCYPAYEAARIDPENKKRWTNKRFLFGLILTKNKLRAMKKEDQCNQRLYALKGQHYKTVIFVKVMSNLSVKIAVLRSLKRASNRNFEVMKNNKKQKLCASFFQWYRAAKHFKYHQRTYK